tara:strand:+ start:287 stop:520 length:234 start_codon:yes stop_codon:yes gene_type:complete
MEELIEHIFRFVASFFRFVIQQILIEGALYGVGYLTLKIITFGKYPISPITGRDKNYILLSGLISIVLIFLGVIYLL